MVSFTGNYSSPPVSPTGFIRAGSKIPPGQSSIKYTTATPFL